MAKLHLKKKSKRMPARRRYKIEKKVREHNRKMKREAKKNPKKVGKKLVQVPNLCPFKEELLLELQQLKKQKEQEKREQKVDRKLARKEGKGQESEKTVNVTEALNELAEAQMDRLEQKWKEDDEDMQDEPVPEERYSIRPKRDDDKSMKVFKREFKKVVEAADVLLEVLDARDPLGTRSKEMEDHILQHPDKRLVFVLNKADLVPTENLNQWLKYLRQFFPTIPFKASTQRQKHSLSQRKKWKYTKMSMKVRGSPCAGADLLMSLLNNYCRNKDIKTSITVGIVGFPNVGKSSIINSLKRNKACSVGATPGLTRTLQQIHLDKKIKLIDSPGVVYGSGHENLTSRAVLRNALKVEKLSDPISHAVAIIERVDKKQLMEKYFVEEFSSPGEFLYLYAKRYGLFKKGGVPNPKMSARKIIDDWNRGKIQYYTVPPEDAPDTHISAEIVQTMAKEFDLEAISSAEQEMIQEVTHMTQTNVAFPLNAPAMDVDKDAEESSELPKSVKITVDNEKRKKKKKRVKKNKENSEEKTEKAENRGKRDFEMTLLGNQKLNRLNKLKLKKLKKEKIKQERKANTLADALQTINLAE